MHVHCSMEGSVAKLREIVALKKKYKVSGQLMESRTDLNSSLILQRCNCLLHDTAITLALCLFSCSTCNAPSYATVFPCTCGDHFIGCWPGK